MWSKRVKKIGEFLKNSDEIHIVTHIDADGITAGAIAYETLRRMNKDFSIEFVKQLDKKVVERLNDENHELVWFTDLGSSISNNSPDLNKVVTDHHVCPKDSDYSFHFNPHLFGRDGSVELSGAGATYLVSKNLDKKNMDLADLAVVGAIGDLQDRKEGCLHGLNREIVEDGRKAGVVRSFLDIRYFGRETRPVYKLLQYANDPLIPGVSGRGSSCISFLKDMGIVLKDGDHWRRWIDLSKDERRRVISGVAQKLLNKGFGYKMTDRIIGEVYTLEREGEGTVLHDAKEFATLLNSTARYTECDVGLNVCLGDRDEWLKKALNLLRGHRHNLVKGIQFAKEEGIIKRNHLQFFHAKNGIRDTIVGIVANMLLNDSETDRNLPLIGFAYKNKKEVKVSARATQKTVDQGLDLSKAMHKAAKKLEGVGGGHNIAAGATIPRGREKEFLEIIEKEIEKQIS
ncbi:MAG: DHH family phosphoesterase [Candidatus Thermoplasmatota archaeon]